MLAKAETNVALIGFQASGKTTIGKLLAQQLGCSFIDTDSLVQSKHASLSCKEIFQFFGQGYFRYLESIAISELEKFQTKAVIATGGGSLLDHSNAVSLKKHSKLIYLETPFELLKARIFAKPSLPSYLEKNDPEYSLQLLFAERAAMYKEWADLTLKIDTKNSVQAVNALHRLMQESFITK